MPRVLGFVIAGAALFGVMLAVTRGGSASLRNRSAPTVERHRGEKAPSLVAVDVSGRATQPRRQTRIASLGGTAPARFTVVEVNPDVPADDYNARLRSEAVNDYTRFIAEAGLSESQVAQLNEVIFDIQADLEDADVAQRELESGSLSLTARERDAAAMERMKTQALEERAHRVEAATDILLTKHATLQAELDARILALLTPAQAEHWRPESTVSVTSLDLIGGLVIGQP